jgi:hypothetical protein
MGRTRLWPIRRDTAVPDVTEVVIDLSNVEPETINLGNIDALPNVE